MIIPQWPPKDWEKFELYLKAGAPTQKIASSFGVDIDTLRTMVEQRYGISFSLVSIKFRSQGELLLEAMQFQKAMGGNVPLLIWLGKIRLNQREPELLSSIPPAQDDIDKDHMIMQLQHKIDILNEMLEKYGYQPETK
jgi:hypothetical protein